MHEPEITLWQERAEMQGGVGWWKQIEEALDQARFLVIVMTPTAMQSEMTCNGTSAPPKPSYAIEENFDRSLRR
jgi:hypothetical protein